MNELYFSAINLAGLLLYQDKNVDEGNAEVTWFEPFSDQPGTSSDNNNCEYHK